MRTGWWCPALLACGLTGTMWSDDTSAAMHLASGSPELRALAEHWRGRGEELLRAFAASDQAQRRGAAVLIGELGARCDIAAPRLLQALVACGDADAARWAGRALLGRLQDISPTALLAVNDPILVLRLLADHDDPGVLADAAVMAQLQRWLSEPQRSEATALLIAQRGSLGVWGRPLVDTITVAAKRGPAGEVVVLAAHQALCLLSRTQRSLATYAGHYDLLVADWSDTLAAAKAAPPAKVEPALAATIARLPEAAALLELLQAGHRRCPPSNRRWRVPTRGGAASWPRQRAWWHAR